MTGVWHVAWKEYRTLRGLWIAVVVFAMMVQGLFVALAQSATEYDSTVLFTITCWMPALYALGCAATMFAAEKDDGTFEWLRGMPLDGLRVMAGKLLYAVPSTAALFALVSLIALWLGNGYRHNYAELYRQTWIVWTVTAYEAVVWGMLVSLLSKRPLQSAVVAVAVGSTVTHLTVSMFSGANWSMESYVRATAMRLALATLVGLIDVMIARNWLHPRVVFRRAAAQPRRRRATRAIAKAAASAVNASPVRTQLARLYWQQWRTSRWIVLGMIGAAATLPFFLYYLHAVRTEGQLITVIAGCLVFKLTMLGAWTFRVDHEDHQYRFLMDRAIDPKRIWFARQSFWAVAAYACCFTALASGAIVINAVAYWPSHSTELTYPPGELPPQSFFHSTMNLVGILLVPLAYHGIGQCTSLLIRSPLLAATSAIVLAVLLTMGLILMGEWSAAWWWAVLPVGLSLYVATRRRIVDWLSERNDARAWLRIGATVVVPCTLVVLALIAFRAYEVPTHVNGVSLDGDPFDVAAYTAPATAEEAETARLYERIPSLDVRNAPQETQSNVVGVLEVPALDDDLDSSAHEVLRARASEQKAADDDALHKQREAFLNDNREALDLLIQATSREACLLRNPLQADLLNPPQLSGSATAYYGLLSNAGRIAEADGKLDVALDYYLRGYRLARHFANRGTSLQCWDSVQAQQAVNGDIIRWAQHEKQTRLLLAQALGACHDERRRGGRDLFEDGPKTTYIVCRRMIDSGETVPALGNGYNGLRYTGSRFPWERTRQRKLLRLVTYWTATLHANDFAVYSPVTWLRAEPLSKSGAMAVKQLISTTPCPAIGAMQYEMAANPPVVPWTESPERALKKALDKLSNASAESASADLPGSHVSDEESIAAPELSPNQPQTPADLFQRR